MVMSSTALFIATVLNMTHKLTNIRMPIMIRYPNSIFALKLFLNAFTNDILPSSFFGTHSFYSS